MTVPHPRSERVGAVYALSFKGIAIAIEQAGQQQACLHPRPPLGHGPAWQERRRAAGRDCGLEAFDGVERERRRLPDGTASLGGWRVNSALIPVDAEYPLAQASGLELQMQTSLNIGWLPAESDTGGLGLVKSTEAEAVSIRSNDKRQPAPPARVPARSGGRACRGGGARLRPPDDPDICMSPCR